MRRMPDRPAPSTDLRALLAKLPAVRSWIDHTLDTHRHNARTVASYGFCRLPAFFPAGFLEGPRVVEVPRVPVPPLASMGLPDFAEFEQAGQAAITFRDTYFVRSDFASDESLHFHELVHVIQWRHLGADRFLTAYAIGHLLAGGYRMNLLEVMAFDLQRQFDHGDPAFEVETLVCAKLDSLVAPMLEANLPAGS